jgi:hypothetical protein
VERIKARRRAIFPLDLERSFPVDNSVEAGYNSPLS